MDITNATSTDLSIAVSTIIGAVMGLWIYNTQKKTANKQDESLRLTNALEKVNTKFWNQYNKSKNARRNLFQ